MKIPFNDLKKQYFTIKSEIDAAINQVVVSASFINGPDVFNFEKSFSEFCGGGYSTACSNGTNAITLALQALHLSKGDEVIVPAQSFIATISPIILLGAKPVFVDINPNTYVLDVNQLEEKITNRTKVITAVHLYGNPCNMDEINRIARKYNLSVLEDAAQAHGAGYKDKKVGLLGDIASFSFYPGKNLGAFGDAGAVVSSNKFLIDLVAQMTNHGRKEDRNNIYTKYTHFMVGSNYRMDTLQAAILNVKLKYIHNWTIRRRAIAEKYNTLLKDHIKIPVETDDAQAVYHLYVIEVDDRDSVVKQLQEQGISVGIHYPNALHQHKAIKDVLGNLDGHYPHAERNARSAISLPIYPEMSDDMVEYVAQKVIRITQKGKRLWTGEEKEHLSQEVLD